MVNPCACCEKAKFKSIWNKNDLGELLDHIYILFIIYFIKN